METEPFKEHVNILLAPLLRKGEFVTEIKILGTHLFFWYLPGIYLQLFIPIILFF